jgi:cellulose synthase/poly-beta-1,6-N-acetylglucosamine synthase-like glycosyltransferase
VNTPAISVLLPARNEAPYLAEALASLTTQTFEDFEANRRRRRLGNAERLEVDVRREICGTSTAVLAA